MKKCVVIYTEGETDEEFYEAVLNHIKQKTPENSFKVDVLKKFCITGIAKFQNKLLHKFEKEIATKDFKKIYDIIVFLCYDTDVFEYAVNPPVDRNKLEANLLAKGATRVIHLKAKSSIEDFIMCDAEGVAHFLNIKKPRSLSGTGLTKIKKLFEKANRTYQKGHKCAGLVGSLDMDKILSKIGPELIPLYTELGVPCDWCKKRKQNR